jgi:hypothetical protein
MLEPSLIERGVMLGRCGQAHNGGKAHSGGPRAIPVAEVARMGREKARLERAFTKPINTFRVDQ